VTASSVPRNEQLTNLQTFRQALYDHALTGRRAAQFELLDALLLSGSTHSFAELSQCPVFRRTWASAYAALEDGRQDEVWLRQYLVQQLPQHGVVLLGIDSTAWPRPRAPTLPDRQFCHSPTPAVLTESVVIGQPYSLVAWLAEPGTAWALPLEVTRIPRSSTASTLAAEQIARLNKLRAPSDTALWIYALDGNYGNHRFWQQLPAGEQFGVVTRLRHDRVLYAAPPPYMGRGRPRKHGPRFAFRDPNTWGAPTEEQTLHDEQWGQVELRVWADLHDKQDAARALRVVRVVVHQERAHPPGALWLSWHGPARAGEEIWRAYGARWSVEPSIRVRKEQLHWTQPAVGSLAAMGVWTVLVSVAMWVLWLARGLVADCPLPWQRTQAAPTPGRVQAGLGALFARLGTPAGPPQPRGKSPGWPAGRARRRRERHRVVKKTSKGPRSPPRKGPK
jgi:DDE superfamily endonuclease